MIRDRFRTSAVRRGVILLLSLMGMVISVSAWAEQPYITVASTTSTDHSGLFGYLLPRFTRKTGIAVRVVAVGTGQALDIARRGDADVVFVHDPVAEAQFVREGFATRREPVMYNDFILLGPRSDPAHLGGSHDIVDSFRKIASARAPFVSRGDRSGTHAAELRFWKLAGIDAEGHQGGWYRDAGTGMGPALNIASAMDAYILADRGTWLSFKNRGTLQVITEGDKRLFNQYSVMLVNPEKIIQVKAVLGRSFIRWILSPEGQQIIADYRIEGQQLFFPNAISQSGEHE